MTIILRICSTIFFSASCLLVYAQVKQSPTIIEVDTLTKVIAALFTVLGFFMAYMQMKMAGQISAVKATFNADLATMKEGFNKKIDEEVGKLQAEIKTEVGKLQTEVKLSQKEIESRMATHHDMANMRQLNILQGEVTKTQLEGLKDQLKSAAELASAAASAAARAAAESVREILKIERK